MIDLDCQRGRRGLGDMPEEKFSLVHCIVGDWQLAVLKKNLNYLNEHKNTPIKLYS
jgi:hypothetical protein